MSRRRVALRKKLVQQQRWVSWPKSRRGIHPEGEKNLSAMLPSNLSERKRALWEKWSK